MAIRGLSLTEENWYVCRQDDGKRDTLEECKEAGATIFYFGAIPSAIMGRLNDATQVAEVRGDMSSQTFHQRGSAKNYDAFRHGITGWENFSDSKDEPIVCEREQEMIGSKFYTVVTEAAMNRVRLATLNEVGGFVFNKNSLQDDERKKLEGLLSRFDGSDTSNAPNAMTSSDENEDASDQQNTTGEPAILPGLPTRKQEPSTKVKSATGRTRKRGSGKTPALEG